MLFFGRKITWIYFFTLRVPLTAKINPKETLLTIR